jgi:hypothetical protein
MGNHLKKKRREKKVLKSANIKRNESKEKQPKYFLKNDGEGGFIKIPNPEYFKE